MSLSPSPGEAEPEGAPADSAEAADVAPPSSSAIAPLPSVEEIPAADAISPPVEVASPAVEVASSTDVAEELDESRLTPPGEPPPISERSVEPPTKRERPSSDRMSTGTDILETSGELSLSSEFFRDDEDSVPPIEPEELEEPVRVIPLSPTALARRALLRRVIGAALAFTGAVALTVIGRGLLTSRTAAAQVERTPAVIAAAAAEAPAEQPKANPLAESTKVEPTKNEPAPAEAAKAEAPAAPPQAEAPAVAAPGEAPKAEPAAEPPKVDSNAAPLDADALKALKRDLERLLNTGKNQDAIEKARTIIAADPTDALPYLFLGSALQSSGKWQDGKEAYSECVRTATKGPIGECRAMGGKK
jgi:hypothetical protein